MKIALTLSRDQAEVLARVTFTQYSDNNRHHLCGFEFDNFILMPAYLIKL